MFKQVLPLMGAFFLSSLSPSAWAGWEPEAKGARSFVEVFLYSEGDPVPPDWPSPPRPVWRGAAQEGQEAATVPLGTVESTFGRSRVAVDSSVAALEAAYNARAAAGSPFADGHANSTWWDTWTVTGGSGTGTLRLSFTHTAAFSGDTWLTYTLQQNTPTSSTTLFSLNSGVNGDWPAGAPTTGTGHTVEVTFTYGVPFQIWAELKSDQSTWNTDFPTFVDMSVTFTGVVLGRGDQLSVASGRLDAYHVRAVPEPASVALMLLGGGLLAGWGRRARHRCS